MRRIVVFSLSLILAACATGHIPATPSSSVDASATPSPLLPLCSGRQWPPSGIPFVYPGVSARALDTVHVQISNTTDKELSYRISGWEMDRLDCGIGAVEVEATRGPISAGTTLTVDATPGGDLTLPMTVGIWEHHCGEACQEPPVALLLVTRSNVKPIATD